MEEESLGADEVGRFLVTAASIAAGKPSHFYCRICRNDVSVLTHGVYEMLRHFQGLKLFPRNKHLCRKTPGWRVFDYEGNPMTGEDIERQRERIWGLHMWQETETTRSRKTSLRTVRMKPTSAFRTGEGASVDQSAAFGQELRTCPTALVPIYSCL